MSRPAADALVLHFLLSVKEAHIGRIVRYMDTWAVHPNTTRNALWRLTEAGFIERFARMRYRWREPLIAWADED